MPIVSLATVFLTVLLTCQTEGRQVWPDDPAFGSSHLGRRRFGQETFSAIGQLAKLTDCPGQICGTLGGQAIAPLLAKADECAQQHLAEKVIEAALDKTNGIGSQASRDKMIEIAKEYRGAERNTAPFYGTSPIEERNSVYCQEAPKYAQLAGIVQAQNPKNNPMVFFDPKVKTNSSSVIKGSQPNTFPFGQPHDSSGGLSFAQTNAPSAGGSTGSVSGGSDGSSLNATGGLGSGSLASNSSSGSSSTNTTSSGGSSSGGQGSDGTVGEGNGQTNGTGGETEEECEDGGPEEGPEEDCEDNQEEGASGGGSGSNGSTSPSNLTSPSGSSDNNTTSSGGSSSSGGQESGGGSGNSTSGSTDSSPPNPLIDNPNNSSTSGSPATNTSPGGPAGSSTGGSNSSPSTTGGSSGLPFIDAKGLGPCLDMRIEFGQGLPGREPGDQAYEPFNFKFHTHGPALNLHIITEFMCDELVNKCGLKNEDKRFADCKAIKESIGTVKKDGSKADLWNAQFGYKTTYATNPCVGGSGTGGHGDGIPTSSGTTS